MNQIIKLLSQRRVWAGIVGVITFIITTLGLTQNYDGVVLTDLLTAIGQALAALIPAVLALWSYIQPR